MRRRYLYQYRLTTTTERDPDRLLRMRHLLRRLGGRVIDVVNLSQPFMKIYRLPDRMPYRFGWRALRTPFSNTYPCWYGSMWFSLARRAVDFVLNQIEERPEYSAYYRKTIVPDESATATLICNAPDLRVLSRDLHYVRWTNSKTGHPDVFTVEDLDELICADAYFARKFDSAKDAAVLDALDQARVKGRRSAVPQDY